ncbi:hypothetical protein OHB41_47475 [Streptomyces sp. NBC_01571]|uniref:hypothetical protein n=1 Tax=Streptomyces sp. NBC_01571 TaxID=2975883 RepID=UPI002252187A|nr:hypothetical protein [Streptomyces sp. NBC_01571]MCX4580643.1 hypothetical protein [Streptomyces sp. NBC_01571]
MVRYVHFQLATIFEVGAAIGVAAPVVLGVHGLPQSNYALPLLCVLGSSALFGLLAVSTRSGWLGGEKRDFENAVPLADPEAILPAPRESMRRSFDGSFVVIVALPTLVFGLLWGPWVISWGLFFVPERIVKGVYTFFWERRHGVLLWRGKAEEQPLGRDQFLYSSPRIATPR